MLIHEDSLSYSSQVPTLKKLPSNVVLLAKKQSYFQNAYAMGGNLEKSWDQWTRGVLFLGVRKGGEEFIRSELMSHNWRSTKSTMACGTGANSPCH